MGLFLGIFEKKKAKLRKLTWWAVALKEKYFLRIFLSGNRHPASVL
jgi:hypothetical protein